MKPPKRMFKGREPLASIRTRHNDPNNIRFIATHEAGHAVLAVVLDLPLESVDIKQRRLPDGRVSVGYTALGTSITLRDLRGMSEEDLIPMVIQIMAGNIAESVVHPECRNYGAHQMDLEDARQRVAIALCKPVDRGDGKLEITGEEMQRNMPRLRGVFDRAHDATTQLVKDNWPAIERVAALLMERKQLSGAEVAAVVNGA